MLLALIISIVVVAFSGPLLRRLGPHGGWAASIIPATLFVYFASAGRTLPAAGALTERIAWIPSLGVSLGMRLDGFSLLFVLIITGIGALVAVYSGAYFAGAPALGARFLRLILLFMSAMVGAVLADDLILMFVFWEATTLLSFLLIGFHSERAEARSAALQSLLVTAGGGLSLFAGILLIGIALDTFSLSEIAAQRTRLIASPVAMPAMALIVIGAFAKSAQFPFHFWLPAAMEAPTPASAFLHSATMVKLGVYLLARFDSIFSGLPAFATTLVVVGSVTMLVAAVRALTSDGYKELLAQSTVASLALLVVLIGLESEVATAAMVTFLLGHALYKAALFFCAGTVIHATHEGRLTRLRGLGSALPMTAAAAALSAISMAGLPPGFGFIAKELVLEGHLHSAGAVTIGISLIVNAIFVAIAVVAGVRPYLPGRGSPSAISHGETPGLILAPLVLGVFGMACGIAPNLIVGSAGDRAVSALLGRPSDLSLSVWHGFTTALFLSVVVVGGGLVIFRFWDDLRLRLCRLRTLDRVLGDEGYVRAHRAILVLARYTTRSLQNGDQRRYSTIVLWFVVAIVFAALAIGRSPIRVPVDSATLDLPSMAVLALIASGAIAATRASSLLVTVLSVGIVGFGSALIYVMNGAPDLALTQFSVEVLVVVIFTALLLRIAPSGRTRTLDEWRRDALLSTGIGALVFMALMTMIAVPLDLTLTQYFTATSYTQAHGRNVVNVIIVDYRGLDTLGEIAVVAFAATAGWSLLRRQGRSGGN
ncbi:MAG: hydrogen gas-evolving membrane-bound hydrogenase subunit E [Vicinamibacterales bacterium]